MARATRSTMMWRGVATMVVAAGVTWVMARPVSSTEAAQTVTRRVFVSAVDRDGAPLAALQPADIEVKVDGKTQAVVSIARATVPFRVAVLVADGGTGGFQAGLGRFVRTLSGHAEFSFTSVVLQPERLSGYVRDLNGALPILSRLGVRGGGRTGAQLVEAILDATRDVVAETTRPVILVLRIGGEAPSAVSSRDVRAAIRRTGATLFVFSTAAANRQMGQRTATIGGGTSMAQIAAQNEDAEANEGDVNLGLILGDGSRESGGQHVEIASATVGSALERVAIDLVGQFDVTYTLQATFKPGAKLSVSPNRRGLTVRAPNYVP